MLSVIDDYLILGAGVSGIIMAKELTANGANVTLVEAGEYFNKDTYPQKEIDANSKLYWGGGIELNHQATIGFLRPKVVGGGSIVNQALLDRFDNVALESWSEVSGIKEFSVEKMKAWYEKAESGVKIQEIPKEYRNANADIFIQGFKNLGYECAPLKRAQSGCEYEKGNDCIQCLSGCKLDSKQSTAITALPKAIKNGLKLFSQMEATRIEQKNDLIIVHAVDRNKAHHTFKAKNLILASGAVGNTKLLLNSNLKNSNPMVGKNFYTHPQFMSLGLYEKEIAAHKGPFQAMKSDEPHFRISKFKLENVFAPPVGLAMLLPSFGKKHMASMKKLRHYACVEVAIRDQLPGTIKLTSSGRVHITKELKGEDFQTYKRGEKVIHQIFNSTGATKVVNGELSIGLHLMGGLCIGEDSKSSVVNPDFQLHHASNIFCADSSIFPNAPGINPSLTIMALTLKAADTIIKKAHQS